MTRDAFDFLVFYLSDYDYASHEHGPDTALEELQRCDAAIGALAEAGGGIDALLERYAVDRDGRPRPDPRARGRLARRGRTRASTGVAAARRRTVPRTSTSDPAAGSTHARSRPGSTASPAAEIALFREGDDAVARREGEELVFAPAAAGGFALTGDASILGLPRCARARVGGAREPERRRGARLGGRGLRVRRPRRRAPRRRRLARLARRGRHRGAAPHRRRRRGAAGEHRRRRAARPLPFRRRRSRRTRSARAA